MGHLAGFFDRTPLSDNPRYRRNNYLEAPFSEWFVDNSVATFCQGFTCQSHEG